VTTWSAKPRGRGRADTDPFDRTGPRLLTYNHMVVSHKQIRDDEGATDLLFKALADPIRRDILRRAHEGRLSVSALAREHPISVTAMQKHVAVLERAELVSKHRVGRESIVRTEADALARARTALDRLEADWRDRIERMEEILETDKGDT
jgi:DNA-binding transcriptional ArsR family regulator